MGGTEHQRKVRDKKVGDKEVLETSQPGVGEIIDRVSSNYQQRRAKTLSTRTKLTSKAFRLTWNAAIAEYSKEHGHCPITPCTPTEATMLRKTVKNVELFQKGDWQAYIKDVVENWDEYTNHIYEIWGKRRGIPLVPSFPYFLKLNGKVFMPFYVKRSTSDLEVQKRRGRGGRHEVSKERITELEEQLEKQQRKNQEQEAEFRKRSQLLLASRKRRKRSGISEDAADELFDSIGDIPEWEDTK